MGQPWSILTIAFKIEYPKNKILKWKNTNNKTNLQVVGTHGSALRCRLHPRQQLRPHNHQRQQQQLQQQQQPPEGAEIWPWDSNLWTTTWIRNYKTLFLFIFWHMARDNFSFTSKWISPTKVQLPVQVRTNRSSKSRSKRMLLNMRVRF